MNGVLANDVMGALDLLQGLLPETDWNVDGDVTVNNPVGCGTCYSTCYGSGCAGTCYGACPNGCRGEHYSF